MAFTDDSWYYGGGDIGGFSSPLSAATYDPWFGTSGGVSTPYYNSPLNINSSYDPYGGYVDSFAPVVDRSFDYKPEDTSWYSGLSDSLGGARGMATLGLGGLSLLGNYLNSREQNQLGRDQLSAQSGLKQQELDALRNMDLAKTDAMMRLVKERQGVQALDPRRYASILASGQLPVEDIAPRDMVDIGQNLAMGGMYADYNQGGEYDQASIPRGALSYYKGSSGGQEDDVNANLSHGEYVFDADSVSALGDGNSDAGAKKLDMMRENIRKHKRSAPKNKIPPKAKDPMKYLKG